MGQGPVLLPPRLPQPSGQLPQTPLRQTNPVLANLQDFLLSALGIQDGLGPDASNAAILGVGASALLPILGTVRKAKTAEQAIAAAEQRIQGIKAYHGSPHDFDQFSLSKIGTGEGAQVYGHGLYFAENPAVAQEYKKQLAPVKRLIEGRPVNRDDPREFAANLLATFETSPGDPRRNVLDALRSDIANPNLLDTQKDKYRQVVQLLESGEPLPQVTHGSLGKTYEVSLNASPDDFLDWDKPLSQQSEKVREFFKDKLTGNFEKRDPMGNELYDAIADELAAKRHGSPNTAIYARHTTGEGSKRAEEATRQLNSIGIKGIRYLDQGSRGTHKVVKRDSDWGILQPDGNLSPFRFADKAKAEAKATWFDEKARTSNYVVFDDAIIDIMKKYGVALPIAAAGLKAQQERSQRGQAHAAF